MAKVKGYFNVNNQTFLGPMSSIGDDKVLRTPRYVEGVCFGEYDTHTNEFVPETNPMHIPNGMIFTQDEQINDQGQLYNVVSGMVEDVGADIVAKGYNYAEAIVKRTPNVITKDEKGKVYPDAPAPKPVQAPKVITTDQPKKPQGAPVQEMKQVEKPQRIEKEKLPSIDLNNLF